MKKTYLPETFLVGENNFDINVCHIWWHLLESADNKRGESRGGDGLLEPFLSVDSLKLSDAEVDEAEAGNPILMISDL